MMFDIKNEKLNFEALLPKLHFEKVNYLYTACSYLTDVVLVIVLVIALGGCGCK